MYGEVYDGSTVSRLANFPYAIVFVNSQQVSKYQPTEKKIIKLNHGSLVDTACCT